ncbi:MAG: helix-hairpin-helix domain-containing protein [Promethearchaeota archaeon]|jgi:predicted flap endonuclease-1-like 5' DNA nuclease
MTLEKEIKRKKENLKYFYQMAQEALDAKDLEHAIEISAKGLEEGDIENEEEWADEFDAVNSASEPTQEDHSLNTTISPEDITVIKGVGVAVAEKLKTAGFHTVKSIAEANIAQLTHIPGIGQKTAQKIMEGAQTIFSRKSLNDFPDEVHIEKTPASITEEDIKDIKTFESPPVQETHFPWFEDKFKINRLGKSHGTKVEYEEIDDSSDYISENEETIEKNTDTISHQDFIMSSPTQSPTKNGTVNILDKPQLSQELINDKLVRNSAQQISEIREELLPAEKHSTIERIIQTLRSLDFHIVEKVRLLKGLSMNSDLIAIKIIHTNEFLDLVLILPIKLNMLKGQIKMSNDQIKYIPVNAKFHENGSSFRLLLDSTIKDLGEVYDAMRDDLINEGKLLSYIRAHLQVDISNEKSFTKKNLFFRSESLQYKVLIEPILLSNNEVRFLEKVIPFPYLKDINLHVLNEQKFSDFLRYLEQKYTLIEEQSDEKSLLISYEDSFNQFLRNGKKLSFPFIGFGAVILILVLTQSFSLLELIVNIGYALLGVYLTSLTYLYVKFFKIKLDIQTDFETPYHRKQLSIDDAGLRVIKEELSSELMPQFVYECFGKKSDSKYIDTIEESFAKARLEEAVQSSQIKTEQIFEEREIERDIKNDTQRENKQEEDEIINKYSAFLED